MKITTSTGLTLWILLASSFALADVPELIPVQGVLTDPEGKAIEGLVDVHFSLYSSENAATPVWSENYDGNNQVYVDQGFFTVYLGSLIGLPVGLIVDSSELWMGISVADDAEMDRVRLAAVPFAIECRQIGDLEAEHIQPKVNIGGDTSLGFCGAGQVVQGIDPHTGAISCVSDQIASTSEGVVSVSGLTPIATYDDGNGNITVEVSVGVGADDVAAGNHTHGGEYIPYATCTSGYVLKYIGSAWTCQPDIDTNTTYSNGAGLSLTGTTFSVNFGGNGTASTAARSDHNHDSTYLNKTGDSMTGVLSVSTAGGTGYAQGAIRGNNTQSGGAGVYGYGNGGYGVAGQGTVGVYGAGTTQGVTGIASSGAGVLGNGNIGVSGTTSCTTSSCYGVYGSNNGLPNAYAGFFIGNVGVKGVIQYPDTQTGYSSVSSAAFLPLANTVAYASLGNGAYRYLVSGATDDELIANVSLPDGVTVKDLACYVEDSSATVDFTYIGLISVLNNTWACGPFSSSGSSTLRREVGGSCSWLINNASNVYNLRVVIGDTTCGAACKLYGCRITYTYTTEGR
jgi:hypothetical protein